ncbi:MAG: matrixin family metalloprotease [Rhizobacter sp.]|nr:matrixin family metalloprotease [Bacteriovorax sp.]
MNKYSSGVLFFLSIFICFTSAEAYVKNLSSLNATVHWSGNVTTVDLYVNPANTQGYSTALADSIAAGAVSQWNGKSRIAIRKNSTSGTNQNGVNELFFSTDPTVFNGTGVVGVTQVYFKNTSGEILEADILINDTFTYSTDVNDVNYLGNVITHEMGHFLGLGHSQVAGSTMLYALARGENQISDDDAAGVYSIYPTGDSTKASLTGKVIGGNALIGVFGAHVQAISLSTGHVAGSTISDTDGTFTIDGLKKNDQYYIYTNPIALIGLPSKYNNVRFDFCATSKKYRGSFFQSCGSSFEGYPEAVKLNSSSVNVGNISIRCGLDVPTGYMQNKNISPATFDLQTNVVSGVGNSFTGYFSAQELSLGKTDYFKMDYSNIDWTALSASGDLYVELKVINQALYSPFKAVIGVKNDVSNYTVNPKYTQETDGWINIESIVRIPITRNIANSSDNNFEISVKPVSVETVSAGLPYTKLDYFPAAGYFEDSLMFYLVSASIVKDNGNGTFSLVSSKNDQLSDNSQCPDATNTYALSSYTIKGASTSSSKKKDDGMACGTVDMSGSNTGSGPGGFFIGLIFSLIVCSLTSSIIRNNKTI